MTLSIELYAAGYVDAADDLPMNVLCEHSAAYCEGYRDGQADGGDAMPDLDLPAAMAVLVLAGKAVR